MLSREIPDIAHGALLKVKPEKRHEWPRWQRLGRSVSRLFRKHDRMMISVAGRSVLSQADSEQLPHYCPKASDALDLGGGFAARGIHP